MNRSVAAERGHQRSTSYGLVVPEIFARKPLAGVRPRDMAQKIGLSEPLPVLQEGRGDRG